MTKHILTTLLFSSNDEQQLKNNNQPAAGKFGEAGTGCLGYVTTKKMIQKFLTHDRVILEPTNVAVFTEDELAKELGITVLQLKRLQKSAVAYRKLAWLINLPLIKLYCSTKFQNSKPPGFDLCLKD